MKLSKKLLIASAVLFVLGFIEAARPGGWGIGIALGAVFLGLFAIVRVLEGETAQFDAEERARIAQAEKAMAKEAGTSR